VIELRTDDIGASMSVSEAMRTQRAIRRLRDDPVPDELVLGLIELALRAPSGGNRQPQQFVVVRDPAVKRELARRNRQAWAMLRRGYERYAPDERHRRLMHAVQWQADHFERIPVLVVACMAHRVAPWPPFLTTTAYGSVYPAVQNLLLAARAEGLGGALITLPLWSTHLARRALGLPRRVRPVAVVPLGWPLGRYGPTVRRPVGHVVHLDTWGNQPYR
jgi:nitroreductase